MQVGGLVKHHNGGFLGIILEVCHDGVCVRWLTHPVGQIKVWHDLCELEVICK